MWKRRVVKGEDRADRHVEKAGGERRGQSPSSCGEGGWCKARTESTVMWRRRVVKGEDRADACWYEGASIVSAASCIVASMSSGARCKESGLLHRMRLVGGALIGRAR
jgi:hypothetical protein